MRTKPLVLLLAALSSPGVAQQRPVLFRDDFERDLTAWEIGDSLAIRIVESGDPAHGKILRLAPAHARLAALIRGSGQWPSYRIEGEVLFPDDVHNYLGFIYHYRNDGGRVDLGSIYIKGNGSYVRVNPRRDWNPARQLYEEFRVTLRGADSIRIGVWQRFAAEVSGRICHFYVGDMTTPKVTFDFYEADSGRAGFKPRVVGGPVWIDNIRAVAIDGLSYGGPQQPAGVRWAADELVTDWEVLGPLTRTVPRVEHATTLGPDSVEDGGRRLGWQPFETDPRGAVITGRVTDFLGDRTVAYFRTTIPVSDGRAGQLQFSSIDDLAVWINGRFQGYGTRGEIAWYDFGRNPDHAPTNRVALDAGLNYVLIRVRGGQYATGGFFARVAASVPSRFPRRASEIPAAWDAVPPLPLTQFASVFGAAPTQRSAIRVAYHNEYLYAAGAFSDDDPQGIRVNSLYRDRWNGDDAFAIYLDPFNDNRNVRWFGTTPASRW